MQQTISSSRSEMSHYAPRTYQISIDPDKIGAVIGTGGKTIRSIIAETKATIDINNDGTVLVGSSDADAAQKAITMIENLTKDVEVGDIYTGKVTRLMNFGAFVEILPGKEGLVHISELADYHVGRVEDVVKIGDEITVKAINIDHMGRINLSRRALMETDSQTPGDRGQVSPSPDYPFKTHNTRPPQAPQNKRFR